jgi:iron complex outermembrane receptor protein
MTRRNRVLAFTLLSCFGPLAVGTVNAQQTPPAEPKPEARGEDPQKLESIVVKGSFLSPSAESAMKLDVPIKDTPLTVTNYSQDFMKAIETSEVLDLYRYMTGVSRGGQSAYDLSLRGFKTTSNDRNALMTDGLPGQVSRFASPPTIGVDHIEVVKGPASVLYGQAQPGGFVNIILKKPQEDRDVVVDLKALGYHGDKLKIGDALGFAVAADATGPIDEAGRFLGRIVLEGVDKDGWRDFTWNRSQYVAPSATWRISPSTSVTFLAEYRYVKETQDLYLPAPNREFSLLPSRTTRLQEPDDYRYEEGYSANLFFSHTFAKDVVWRFNARYVKNHDYTKWYDTVAMLSDLTTLQRRARIGDNHRESYYFDTMISIPFKTGPVEHKALAGITGGYDDLDANRIQFVNGATTGPLARPGPGSLNINVYNPVYGLSPRHENLPPGTFQHRITASKPIGAYVTDFLTFTEQWKATAGIRFAKEKQTFEELTSSVAVLPSRSQTPSDYYPMAGVLYEPSKNVTFYASYSTSFVPIAPNMQDASGVFSFDPEKGKQYEVGTKADFMNGRLFFTLSFFDIKKVNTLALVTCNPGIAGTCMQPVGEETSRGAEFEMNVKPSRNWQVILGYSHVDAKIARSNSASTAPLVGSQLTNAPKDKAQLWSRYDFADGSLNGLGIGVGVAYVSGQPGNVPTAASPKVLQIPSYTVADLVFYYRFQKADLALKIGNVFDKVYWDSVGSTLADLSVVPGAPRNFTLSARIAF